MKHVFEGLKSSEVRDMATNVEDAVKALHVCRGRDFRLFKLPNDTSVRVKLKPCPNGSEEIQVEFKHKDVENVVLVSETFVSTVIGRRDFFAEIAEDVGYEVIMAVNEELMSA